MPPRRIVGKKRGLQLLTQIRISWVYHPPAVKPVRSLDEHPANSGGTAPVCWDGTERPLNQAAFPGGKFCGIATL